jgi:gamma-glutamyltranspeptidase/glutathione hydrolase
MIITTVTQVLLNRIDLGMTLPEAVAAPRASQRNTEAVAAEEAFRTAFEAELTPFGHQFATAAEIGAVAAIEVDADGLMTAVAEPVRRGGGTGLVVEPAD